MIECMHAKGVIYGNFSREHIVIGTRGSADVLHFVSFRQAVISTRLKFYPELKYLSSSKYQSRALPFTRKLATKDDIESMIYLILKMCFGNLTWEGLKGRKRSQEYQQTLFQHKQQLFDSSAKLGLPQQITDLLAFQEALKEGEAIDYAYLKGIFVQGLEQMGGQFQFDWVLMDVLPLFPDRAAKIQHSAGDRDA